MDFYCRLLFQIDEARRYISDGRLERLRLALVLLDNAAEMLLWTYIEDAFVRERWSERLKQQWEQMAHLPDLPESAREALAFVPLSSKEKGRIRLLFEEKLKYVADRKAAIPNYLVAPLLHLHQYRNEAYHRNEIRPETIRMACLILFEIVCELSLILSPSTISYSSAEDYSWLQERFGWSRGVFMHEWVPAAIQDLRASVLSTRDELADVLTTYMEERFTGFEDGLDFLRENSSHFKSRAAALAGTYEFHNSSEETPKKPLEVKTLAWIEGLAKQVGEIRTGATRVDVFRRFAEIERQLEPIESALNDFTGALDAHIQLQIDIARGK